MGVCPGKKSNWKCNRILFGTRSVHIGTRKRFKPEKDNIAVFFTESPCFRQEKGCGRI